MWLTDLPAELLDAVALRLPAADATLLALTCTTLAAVVRETRWRTWHAAWRQDWCDALAARPPPVFLARLLQCDEHAAFIARSKHRVFQTLAELGNLPLARCMVNTLGSAWTAADTGTDRHAAFRAACRRGNLAFAQWLADEYNMAPQDAHVCEGEAFWFACSACDLPMLEWFAERFGLSPRVTLTIVSQALQCACAAGNLPMAQWCISVLATPLRMLSCDLAQHMQKSGCITEFFQLACMNGHLALAQWLDASFGIARDKVLSLSKRFFFFQRTCGNGHLDVVRWLAERFNLTPHDSVLNWVNALHRACAGGHIPVAEWLLGECQAQLSASDAQTAFVKSCLSSPQMAQWAADKFCTAAQPDHHRMIGNAFWNACAFGELRTAQWLVDRFGDAACRGQICSALFESLRRSTPEVAQWLTAHFGLTVDDVLDQNDVFDRGMSILRLHFLPDTSKEWLRARFGLDLPDIQLVVHPE